MLLFILSILVIIPAIIATIRFSLIDKKLNLYVYYLYLSFIVEAIAEYSIKNNFAYSLNYNIYIALSFIIFLKIFINYEVINIKNAVLLFFISICLKALDLLMHKHFTVLNTSSIFDCSIIIFFSVKTINKHCLFSKESLKKSLLFWVMTLTIFINFFDILNTIVGWLFFSSYQLTKLTTYVFLYANVLSYILLTYILLCFQPNKK